MFGRKESQSVSSCIFYILLIKRRVSDIRPLSPEGPCGDPLRSFSTYFFCTVYLKKIFLHHWFNSKHLISTGPKIRLLITLISLISCLTSFWDNHCHGCCLFFFFFEVFIVLSYLLFKFLNKSSVSHERAQAHRPARTHMCDLGLLGMNQLGMGPV